MAQAAVTYKCEFCDSEEDVNYFCTSCEELLCSKCKLGHAKSKKTKNDIVIPLAQARKDGIVYKSTTSFCSEHSSEQITLFCLQCNQFVCAECQAGQHKKHHVTIPDEIKESKTEELINNIAILKEKKTVFENAFEIEGKVHIQFSKSIDQVRKNITDQKTKIIEELNLLCDEQFSELTILQQNEDERYSKACSEIQVQNQAVTMAIQTSETSITSSSAFIIIQATIDSTQTLQKIKEPEIPPTSVATYEQGDRTRPSILQIQGKTCIKQTPTVSNLPSGSSQPTDNKIPEKNTETGVKPKLMTDVHKVKIQEQKPSDDNKQQKRTDVNKPRFDMRKVKVKNTIKVKNQFSIHVIVPLQNKTAWVQSDRNPYFSLINNKGKIISKSVPLPNIICDAKQYRNELLVTCWRHPKIYRLSQDGKSTSAFSDLSPYYTGGLCVTQDMNVIVCLVIPDNDKKVVRLDTSGHIIQTLQLCDTEVPLVNDLYSVTSLTTGDVIVSDGKKLVGVDSEGKHLFVWKGEIHGRKLDAYNVLRIAHDNNNNLFVTDCVNHKVFVLDKNGSGVMCMLDRTQGIDVPRGISVDDAGQLWVGCSGGNICIIEY